MITVLWITVFFILLYLAYPVCLLIFSSSNAEREKETDEINSVSLILLSYNGKKYLKDKINFLIKELSCFQHYELIIVDDNSTDGSKVVLDLFKNTKGVKIIYKQEHKGIPHSMNRGVNYAQYETVIFCDQRQRLSENILQRIVEPLKYKNIGAVSGCISHLDKENKYSIIRRHENFIKLNESKAGSLIGVYGPFYAIKKQCYSDIPDYIILDDLYLSLRILKTKKIILKDDCLIIDNNFSKLYDYKRIRRYMIGFLQILKEKTIISDLSKKQKIMLIWHKYLRLLIPVFLFISYISIGFLITQGVVFVVLFCILTALGLISVFPGIFKFQLSLKNFIRMNILYFIALIDVFINKVILQKRSATSSISRRLETGNLETQNKTQPKASVET